MTNDIDELTTLNRDFVASVQNSDVRRFDEILAPEFYCSNPDKSLVDRAAFLEQTAKPVVIKNLRAHDVKIRIMGDFAIIHAATSYTTLMKKAHNKNGKSNVQAVGIIIRCNVVGMIDTRKPGASDMSLKALKPGKSTITVSCPELFGTSSLVVTSCEIRQEIGGLSVSMDAILAQLPDRS